MSTETLWYLARGSGVVTLLLLTVVVALGIATRSGRTLGALTGHSKLVVAATHRSTALLALVFLTVHVVTLLFDPYAQLRLVDLVLPFTSGFRPLYVGLGALALDLLIAITVTSLLRERLCRTAWRAVHRLAYALWPIALVHGFGAGSDSTQAWMLAVDVLCVAVVGAALTRHPALTSQAPEPLAPQRIPAGRMS